MEESYESCILRAIASNFSMAASLALTFLFGLHIVIFVPAILFGLYSKSQFVYSLVKWSLASLLILSAMLRKMERVNSASRIIEQVLIYFFFFFITCPLRIGVFRTLYAFAAALGLFRLPFKPSQQVQPGTLFKHLKGTLLSAQYSKCFPLFTSCLLVTHIASKLLFSSMGLAYSLMVPLQILAAVASFSVCLLIAVGSQSLFSFFFQEENFRVSTSGVTLLDGLASSNNTVQYFALHELFCIAMYEEGKRKRIFQEIVGDVVVSREVVIKATKYFEQTNRSLEKELRTTKKIKDKLQSRLVKSNSGDSDIFQQNGSTVMRFFQALLGNGITEEKPKMSLKKSPPSFLKPIDTSMKEKPFVTSSSSDGNDLTSLLFQSDLFCSAVSIYTTYKETMLLASYKAPIEYAALGISAFAIASFYEDIHGQVQLALPQLLIALDRLHKALAGYSQTSSYTPQSEMERTVKRSMDAIVERYRESLVSLSDYPSIAHLL